MDTKGFAVVEVTGESCAACYSLMPEARAAAEENGVAFFRADGETSEEYIRRWNVERVPAVLILKNGVPAARCYGYQPREILSLWIEAKLEEIKQTP